MFLFFSWPVLFWSSACNKVLDTVTFFLLLLFICRTLNDSTLLVNALICVVQTLTHIFFLCLSFPFFSLLAQLFFPLFPLLLFSWKKLSYFCFHLHLHRLLFGEWISIKVCTRCWFSFTCVCVFCDSLSLRLFFGRLFASSSRPFFFFGIKRKDGG